VKILIILGVVLVIAVISVIGGFFSKDDKKDEIYPLY